MRLLAIHARLNSIKRFPDGCVDIRCEHGAGGSAPESAEISAPTTLEYAAGATTPRDRPSFFRMGRLRIVSLLIRHQQSLGVIHLVWSNRIAPSFSLNSNDPGNLVGLEKICWIIPGNGEPNHDESPTSAPRIRQHRGFGKVWGMAGPGCQSREGFRVGMVRAIREERARPIHEPERLQEESGRSMMPRHRTASRTGERKLDAAT